MAMLAAPVNATDFETLSDADRKIFREEVRAYLLENPEVLLEAMQVLRDRDAQQESQADAKLLESLNDEILNDGVSFVGGNLDGDVTIVEFLDYRCGYCRKAHADMAALLKQDGNIRWVVKEFPILGPDSDLSAKLAVATLQHYGEESYERLHNVLMEFKGPVNEKTLPVIAKEAEIDLAPIQELVNSDAVVQHIARIHELGRKMSITGTPAFVIKDMVLRGYLPLADMQNIVAQARSN
jgi:protein-disulfide isomerase